MGQDLDLFVLVEDEARLPARAGVLTPATAFGDVLVDRLRSRGFTLTVAEDHASA